jgi:hypothetical protein
MPRIMILRRESIHMRLSEYLFYFAFQMSTVTKAVSQLFDDFTQNENSKC